MMIRMDRTAAFYAGPSYRGAGFPIFSGSRRQRGGSILGAIKSMVMPVLGTIGKSALKQAVGFAGDVVGDVTKGRSIRSSLKSHGLKRLRNVGSEAIQTVMSSRKRRNPSKRRGPPTKRRRHNKGRRANF